MVHLIIRYAMMFCVLVGLVACQEAPLNSTTSPTSAPTITTQPASVTANEGTPLSLSVVAAGNNLSYQWYKNFVPIAGATSSTYSIPSAASTDGGTYTVFIDNANGSVTSSPATVTINASTNQIQITTQPESVSVAAGGTATFTVVATGSNPIYQWFLDDVAISGANSASYTISSVSTANAGTYKVIVSNGLGGVTSSPAVLSITIISPNRNASAFVAAADAFLTTLSPAQKTVATSSTTSRTVLFDYKPIHSAADLKLSDSPPGLALNSTTLTPPQLAAASTLILTALSSAGITLLMETRRSEDEMALASSPWGANQYSLAFIGTPSNNAAWSLQLTGHHLAYVITYNAPPK